MESLSLFDLVWRVILAGFFALTPGMAFWMLVLGLIGIGRYLCHGRRASASASEAARP
jgi:hypothetical protein